MSLTSRTFLALAAILIAIVTSCSRIGRGSIVDVKRLITPSKDEILELDIGFRSTFVLVTHGEPVLVTDPIYLMPGTYNSSDDEKALYLREHAVLLSSFGGDAGGPALWKDPYLLIPLSMHYEDADPAQKPGVKVLPGGFCSDSGSLVFLPFTSDMPPSLRRQIDEVVRKGNGALLPLPEGKYSFFYEQFDAPQANMVNLYRNIVARRD